MGQPKSRLGASLQSKGKSVTDKIDRPIIPWTGPCGEGPNGGVTQGMIGRFLICRDRFKVRVYDGLGAKERFEPLIEYGNYWHQAEEAYKMNPKRPNMWLEAILQYYTQLCNKYPMDREAITHWYSLCREQFPIYVEYWESEKEEQNRTRLLSEQTFDVPYKLPYSGRTVRLRGKWDGVSLIDKGIWLDENKTKSQVDQTKIVRQLKFDLQTLLYIVALKDSMTLNEICRANDWDSLPSVKGVRYNVVKRSAHKSPDSMVKKIREDVADNRAGEWFGRWNVEITQTDIDKFKKTCLDPALEQMCFWWRSINGHAHSQKDTAAYLHSHTWRMPLGVWNPLDHGEDIVDEYLNTGSRVGLQRITNLFPELQTL